MKKSMKGRVLIIAGSDSSGGAGIQADIKTVTALGGYAMTAITALTAQNTEGVNAIHAVPPDFVRLQIEMALHDIGADSIKTGMLHTHKIIMAVALLLNDYREIPLVIDPVMIAKSGRVLLEPDAIKNLKEKLFPLATIITPNIPEAEALLGIKINNVNDMEKAALKLLKFGSKTVLLKGGHLEGHEIYDVWATHKITKIFEGNRINSRHTHGTGCTLSSAISAYVAEGERIERAVEKAREYVHGAILHAPGFGEGSGPLNHTWQINNV